MLSAWAPFFLFLLGLSVGSFMNVLVLRFGFFERAPRRSHCMSCNRTIRWHDLVPVLSFCALSGRCRACGSGLSIQYPLLELAVGALFFFSALLVPPVFSLWSVAAFAALLAFLATLSGIVAYDLRHTLIPLPFVFALAFSALAASVSQSFFSGSFAPLIDGAEGALALLGFFFAVVFLTREKGMGEGDAYVAGAIGLLLGLFRGIEAVMVGVWSGTLVALALLLVSSLFPKTRLFGGGRRVTMKTELPLVPFLAFGVAVALYTDFSPLALAARFTGFFLSGHI